MARARDTEGPLGVGGGGYACKTTTASLLAWILEHAGLAPGFLIGGAPANFEASARLGRAPFFIIEADEYDTAFFDKRAKICPYRPRTLILNNLEFDHADIYENVAAIERQFHHLVRTVPGTGRIVWNAQMRVSRALSPWAVGRHAKASRVVRMCRAHCGRAARCPV